MRKYTKDAPFEFEGIKVWRETDSLKVMFRRTGLLSLRIPTDHPAYIAFIEAERDVSEVDSWHYTNEAETEARKGRWTVTDGRPQGLPGRWGISNDDLRRDGDGTWCNAVCNPNGGLSKSGLTPSICEVFEGVMTDFLTWHAAQQQPEEPTGWGAVVEVEGCRYVRNPGATENDPHVWRGRNQVLHYAWGALLSRGPVTILSPGIES